jgi:hypothetical protein
MIDGLDARVAALVDAADDSSWAEVVCRARALRRRRRLRPPLAIAATLTLAVLVAAPALGLRGKIVRLFSDAEPAPQRIEKAFAGWNAGVPPHLGPGVQAGRAIEVLEVPAGADGKVVLWLAPLTRGGFCTLLDLEGRGGGGGCDHLGYDRLSVTVSLHGRVSPDGSVLSGPVLLDGYTGTRQADSLLLRFEDGETTTIPLIWVSAPVDTGFFVYAVPKPHWHAGHLPTTLTLLAADGDQLDQREIHGIPTAGSLSRPGSPR